MMAKLPIILENLLFMNKDALAALVQLGATIHSDPLRFVTNETDCFTVRKLIEQVPTK